MAEKEISELKKRIVELETQLQSKQAEVIRYQQELLKFSHNLDMVLSAAQKDTETLKSLQAVLVPTEIPQLPGFEISRKFVYGSKFGGDYFDIFAQKDKMKFGVLLSSASSYSMSAHFLSVVLEQHQLLEGKDAYSVGEVVTQLSGFLSPVMSDKDEVHLFYAQFDRRKMKMKLCCVGGIKGFIQSMDATLKVITSETPSLKKSFKYDINELELNLEPNMRMCFCSYGLSEVLSVDDMADTVEETKHQGVHELRNQLLVKAQLKSGLDNPLRDQTVIVIEISDNVVKLAQ